MVGRDTASNHGRSFGNDDLFDKISGSGILGGSGGNANQHGIFSGYHFDAEGGIYEYVIDHAAGPGKDDGLGIVNFPPHSLEDYAEVRLYLAIHAVSVAVAPASDRRQVRLR